MSFFSNIKRATKQAYNIPIVFFGLGVYRAWISTAHTQSSNVDAINSLIGGLNLYDLSLALTALACAIFARKISPFVYRKQVSWITVAFMTSGSLLSILVSLSEDALPNLVFLASILSGIGTALIILMWVEFYSSLSPFRVALYYSGSILFGELIKFLMSGLTSSFQMGVSLFLPLISVIWLKKSMEHIPKEDQPKTTWGHYTFPWKPVALMAVCAFAYGYGTDFNGERSALAVWGVILPVAVVFVGTLLSEKRLRFGFIYRFALPIMIVGFLLVTPSLGFNAEITDFCASAGYISFSMLIMLILCNITYRFGISIVWLCGIERGIRYLFIVFGRSLNNYLVHNDQLVSIGPTINIILAIVLVIAFSVLFFPEKEFASKWGLQLRNELGASAEEKLVIRVADLSHQYSLSAREEEVLLLLAQKQSILKIEQELYIANGTVKAHIRHIYVKFGINSREELYEILGA